MFKNRFKRQMARRLAAIGSVVDTSFMVYVNNNEPVAFPSMDNVIKYLDEYREATPISRLQIFRVETYSL